MENRYNVVARYSGVENEDDLPLMALAAVAISQKKAVRISPMSILRAMRFWNTQKQLRRIL